MRDNDIDDIHIDEIVTVKLANKKQQEYNIPTMFLLKMVNI